MRFVDVNILVYAHRPEAPDHDRFRTWLEAALVAEEPLGVADIVLSGFVRVATHPRIFKDPTPVGVALDYASSVRSASAAVHVAPNSRTWPIVQRLVAGTGVRGNDIHDAYLAAMAVGHGATLVSADRGFARFPNLAWMHPLDAPNRNH